MKTVRVGDVAEQLRGVTFSKADAITSPREGYVAVLTAGNIQDGQLITSDLTYVPAGKVSVKQQVRQNDVVICASSGSLSVVGKAAQSDGSFAGGFGAFLKVLRPGPEVDPRYFAHYFQTQAYRRTASSLAAGANINNLKNEHLSELRLPLPPLSEQRRIAAILDHVDALRAKRREVITHLEALPVAIFLDMFGDPARNPFDFPLMTIRSIAAKFSDGPFGSNLKSSHYVDSGVPVVRLQNIGVGQYLDHDRAFISEEHYAKLSKHDCLPGDILIGTLGDPNLRACIQPRSLPRALNKADCIQFRTDPHVADALWACWLLNMPGTLSLASSLAHGQTRTRIAMGQLRELKVPVPPINLQHQFAERVAQVTAQQASESRSRTMLDELFASLQSRAFRGEL